MFITKGRAGSKTFAVGMLTLAASMAAADLRAADPDRPPSPTSARTGEPASKGRFAPHSWRSEVYQPPDFERFFPDDPDGAGALAALWDEVAKEKDRQEANPKTPGQVSWWKQESPHSDDEILRTARRGLRRIDGERRVWVIRWIGGRYLSEATPQDPDAIEILYHALDYRGDGRYDNPTCRFAQAFCSTYLRLKTHAILRALTELSMREDNEEILSEIVTGAAMATEAERAEMLADLAPYLTSPDSAVQEKARAVQRMFKAEMEPSEWAIEAARRRALAKYGSQLPKFRDALQSGTSRTRLETLEFLLDERIELILDASFLDALRACADDPEENVRQATVRAIEAPWSGKCRENPEAIDLAVRLLKDRSPGIRRYVATALLNHKVAWDRAVVRAIITVVLTERDQPFDLGWLKDGLSPSGDAVEETLREYLRDPALGRATRGFYRDLVGAEPPADVPAGPYAKPFEDLYDYLGSVYPNFPLKGIDWTAVGRELIPRASTAKSEREFGLLVEELVARLEDSHAAVLPGKAKPPMPDLPRWDPGLACLIDDRGRPVVYHVDRGSPAERAGITPGMAVVSVDDTKASEAIDRWMRRQRTYVGYSSDRLCRADAGWGFLRRDERGDRISLVLEEPDGASKSVAVTAELGPRYLPRLPVPRPGIADAADVSWTKLDARIGIVYVRRIRQGLEASLDRALRELGEIEGLILDVRGNSGGGFNTATAFGNFEPAPATAGGPERPHYAGSIALLLDERTISAGEGWASWFVARKRARIFGSTSAGASSRKVTYELTNGLYKVVVPVKAYTGFLHRVIERRGLEPDVEVRCTARDLSRGKDTVLETAADWLRQNGPN